MQELTHYINGAHVKASPDVLRMSTTRRLAKFKRKSRWPIVPSSNKPWPTPPPHSPLGLPSTPSAAPGF